MSSRKQRRRKFDSESEESDDDASDDEEDESYSERGRRKKRGGKRLQDKTPARNNNIISSDDDEVPLSRRKRSNNNRKQTNYSSGEEESEELNSDSPPAKKQKSNIGKSFPRERVTKTRDNVSYKEPSDSSDSGGKSSIAGAKKRKRRRKKGAEDAGRDGDFVSTAGKGKTGEYGRETTGRVRAKVKYDDNLSDSEFDDLVLVKNDEMEEEEEEVDIECIEKVLDHREGKVGATGEKTKHFAVLDNGDPNITLDTTELETQYLIKWMDKAHIDNTWETEETLEAMKVGEVKVKGLTKVNKYQGRVTDYQSWKRTANPEDVEFSEIDIELGRELLKTHFEIDRIFCKRKNEEEEVEFYVKWRNLAYSEATWESESLVKARYLTDYQKFKRRKKAKTEPKDYRSSMKGVKVKFAPMKTQPDYIGDETLRLRDYQLDGISFLINAWCKGNSIILADEMGLGKTIQTICFLKYLFHNYPFKGPMLVCVPLSTVASWQTEFSQWAPDMNTVTYLGDASSRDIIREFECENEDGELSFNVLLASYEMVCRDRSFFQDISWSNIVVDEAHRLKNEESLLYKVLVDIDSHHRLLLTGTPLQNNLKELWCLLNYLKLPDIEDWPSFEEQFGKPEDVNNGYIGLHSLLKPYIIRRLKKDVEKSLPPKVEQILRVEMTKRQKNMYKMVLTKNYHFLSKGGKSQVSLVNIMMQLRKTTNHVELIHEAEPEEQRTREERLKDLTHGSGKMLLLDKLLTRFREKGDRVLIFSQMVIMLNIIQEYLQLRRFPYQRLDGSVNSEKRKQAIASFNSRDSADFCFLLSTKAGGLGINLQTANRVIIYDSDFNPQNDLQAIARAHRIGQKDEVQIFRLVASSSVDEDIIQKAKNKMVLDHLVIQNMDTTGKTVISGKKAKTAVSSLSKDELNTIIKFGAADLFKENEEAGDEGEEVDLDAILSKAETREDVEAPISEANKELLSAFKCTNLRLEEAEEELDDIDEKKEATEDWEDIIPEDLRSQFQPKQEFDGLELVSDNEDLYSSIANRRKKRSNKKIVTVSDIEDEVDRGSDYEVDDNKESDSDIAESDTDNLTEEEKKMRDFLRRQKLLRSKPVFSFKCLESGCSKAYTDKRNLKRHLRLKHKVENCEISEENYFNLPEILSTKMVCQLCKRNFSEIDYKLHINFYHGGIEPEINYNDSMLREWKRYLAKQDLESEAKTVKRNVICLECSKCFTNVQYLRAHMTSLHEVPRSKFELTEENFLNLPSTNSPILRCFPCSLSFATALTYKVHILNAHKSVEPAGNLDQKLILEYEEKTKILICTDCKERFTSHGTLRAHMLGSHNIEDYQIQEDNYYNLPQVKSVINKCRPCNKFYGKTFLYRLHIKNKHGSVEPPLNYLAVESTLNQPVRLIKEDYKEISSQDEDFVCLICDKKYKESGWLKSHIIKYHLGLQDHTINSQPKTEEPAAVEDPLADPLADGGDDTQSPSLTEGGESPTKHDYIEFKDIELIKSNGEISSPKPVTIPLKPKPLTGADKGLVEKMLNDLRKHRCAHCSSRFDTKSALSIHEKGHLKAKLTEKPAVNKVRGSVKESEVWRSEGIPCLKCDAVCKDSAHYKNHILSHYYRNFDDHIPARKPFECPVCCKASRDKITLIRHFAFTHQKIFELTDLTPEDLNPKGARAGGTPKVRKNPSSALNKMKEVPGERDVENNELAGDQRQGAEASDVAA